jgi:aspartate/glutamate racemase
MNSTSKNSHNSIAILGGMGPQASSKLYNLLIEKSIKTYGVEDNSQFPEILLNSIPVPDFISNKKKFDEAREILVHRTIRLDCLWR